MKIEPFRRTYQRKRTARKRRTEFHSHVSHSSPGTKSHDQDNGGYNIEKHYLPVTVNLRVSEETKNIWVAEQRKQFNTSSLSLHFPHRPRSKTKVAWKQNMIFMHMAERVSGEGISKECSCPTSTTARPHAPRNCQKRKTKSQFECDDSEVIVPRRIHLRGRARRSQNTTNTITSERGKLDSTTFLHYFTHIWSAFPEEKVKSVAYFDPLWFDLYANDNSRAMVLNWIKEKDVFSKKYVLVPIVIWSHWSLLILCHFDKNLLSKTNTPCMLLLDSLHAIGPTRLEPLIRRLLFDMYKSEERLVSKEQLKKVPLLIPKVPQQKKGEECGFYVLYYISLFLENAPENFDISKGYPYFMKKDWFTVEAVESFCKSLDAFPVVLIDDDDDDDDSASVDSSSSVEFIGSSSFYK